MVNSYQNSVSLQEVDFSGKISINAIIRRILNTAGEDARNNGFGVNAINRVNHTWVLSRLSVEIGRRPKIDSRYSISTWISDFGRMLSTRNFELTDSSGECFAAAVSQWCIIDIDSRSLVNLNSLGDNSYVVDTRPSPITPAARLGRVTPTRVVEHTAGYTDIDFNGHFNTIRYIELLLNTLPFSLFEEVEGSEGAEGVDKAEHKGTLRLDIHFIHETLQGEHLTINIEQSENSYLFEIVKECNTVAVKAQITRQ